jgi:hypothetical protein
MRRWRSSTISSALAGSIARGERAGREDASASAAGPPDKQRPSYLRAVGGVTPWHAPANGALNPSSIICPTLSMRRA